MQVVKIALNVSRETLVFLKKFFLVFHVKHFIKNDPQKQPFWGKIEWFVLKK